MQGAWHSPNMLPTIVQGQAWHIINTHTPSPHREGSPYPPLGMCWAALWFVPWVVEVIYHYVSNTYSSEPPVTKWIIHAQMSLQFYIDMLSPHWTSEIIVYVYIFYLKYAYSSNETFFYFFTKFSPLLKNLDTIFFYFCMRKESKLKWKLTKSAFSIKRKIKTSLLTL
jgi:hypothetical protein